jgi:antitoxin component YwqK of YwqJK toxin-antitoxin module
VTRVAACAGLLAALAAGHRPLECPPGTSRAGDPPPAGNAEWCERPGPDGKPRRHGPGREYYELDLVRVEASWADGQLHGPWIELHRDGTRAVVGQYRDGEKDGAWVYRYESGRIEEEVTFDRGRRHGPFASYWPNGRKKAEGRFCFGFQCGRWTSWSEEGVELGTITYEEIRGTP